MAAQTCVSGVVGLLQRRMDPEDTADYYWQTGPQGSLREARPRKEKGALSPCSKGWCFYGTLYVILVTKL